MIVRLPPVLELIQREYIGEWKPEWGLTENGKPHPGNFTYRLLKNEEPFTHSGSIVADFAERFMKHVWTIITFGPDKRIQTGDNPITINFGNDRLPPEKWQIRMPLDPHALLTTNNTYDDNEPYKEGTFVAKIALPEWSATGMLHRIL